MKLIMTIVILIFISYVIFQGVRINQYRLIGKQLVADTVAYEQLPNNPENRVLIIGNSLQAGVGASSPETSIPGLLGADYSDWQITNLAESGDETADALAKLQSFDASDFDLVIVQIGTNDIFHATVDLDQSVQNLNSILELAQNISDQVIYVTSGSVGYAPVFPPSLDWYFTNRSQSAIPKFIQVAESLNIPVVDNYRERSEDLFEQNPDKYYAADKFHLSDAGYQVWYQRLQEKLIEIGFTS